MTQLKKELETEIKVMISKEEYEGFFCKATQIYNQTNYYYKVNDDMYVRLRKLRDKYFLQYKELFGESRKALKENYEYSMDITEADYIVIKNNPNALYEYLDIKDINIDCSKYKGCLKTIRGHIVLDESMNKVQVDLNEYNGKVDYELEWEIDKNEYDKAVEILKDNGIDLNQRKVGLTKFARMMHASSY